MKIINSIALALAMGLVACNPQNQVPAPSAAEGKVSAESHAIHPDWSKDAVIYQINTRQYSPEGTFAEVQEDLPRLKDLGVDILWLMPIHPIGEAKRKGTMGSPYAVKDFRAVNPELGTLDDFKSLVGAVHDHDMKIIIDWVANHTAWDNDLITQHPDWYTRGADGNMQHPEDTDWVDVADLNYDKAGLRDYMTDALIYWVKDVGIDGYRCDVAGMVPTDFWESARTELNKIKPVFMLAEWQEPELHNSAFSASYAWRWKEIMQNVVKGKAGPTDIMSYYKDYQKNWPKHAMRMTYTSNHDQNTWDGTPFEIYGDALPTVMALQFVGDGIPLIYNGQEAGNNKRLEFFEKDLINWKKDHPFEDLFSQLIDIKTENPALHNAPWGGRVTQLNSKNQDNVLSIMREKDGNKVIGLFNFTDQPQDVSLMDDQTVGAFKNFETGAVVTLDEGVEFQLNPWEYRIFTDG